MLFEQEPQAFKTVWHDANTTIRVTILITFKNWQSGSYMEISIKDNSYVGKGVLTIYDYDYPEYEAEMLAVTNQQATGMYARDLVRQLWKDIFVKPLILDKNKYIKSSGHTDVINPLSTNDKLKPYLKHWTDFFKMKP